ncbi:hypothetical protein GCM10010350_31600 [Streptomyces galilaeus]|nr:hypothetical protein GCM10010350_31600 [Streptomyces galilaeus]
MHLGDPPPPGRVAHKVQDHGQRCRQLAVQGGPVEPGRRAERFQPGRDIGRGVGVDGPFSELGPEGAEFAEAGPVPVVATSGSPSLINSSKVGLPG